MIGTEFLQGQGLGNQLFCYITTRAIAKKQGCEFGTAGQEQLAVNIHSNKGMYFMDLDLGINIEDTQKFIKHNEKEERIFLSNSTHDLKHGCYISGTDKTMQEVKDNTLLYGNMQAEEYFETYKEEIKKWLQVKKKYDSYEYAKENLCIINIRGGEYVGSRALFLKKSYWKKGVNHMKKIRSDMEFMIITDDVKVANSLLPEIPAYHFDLAKDYVTIKNATYLLLSNSSFAFFPAYTSETVKYILAPKYWARHNVSQGYWASEQNIYTDFHYQDRKGNIFSAEECKQELQEYKEKSKYFHRINLKPSQTVLNMGLFRCKCIYYIDWIKVIYFGIIKRIRKVCRRLL